MKTYKYFYIKGEKHIVFTTETGKAVTRKLNQDKKGYYFIYNKKVVRVAENQIYR